MGIAKLGFSGLKYLFGKSAKTVANEESLDRGGSN